MKGLGGCSTGAAARQGEKDGGGGGGRGGEEEEGEHKEMKGPGGCSRVQRQRPVRNNSGRGGREASLHPPPPTPPLKFKKMYFQGNCVVCRSVPFFGSVLLCSDENTSNRLSGSVNFHAPYSMRCFGTDRVSVIQSTSADVLGSESTTAAEESSSD